SGDEGFTASMATCGQSRQAEYVQMASREGGTKSSVAGASQQGIATHFSIGRAVLGTWPPFRAANAAASGRLVLARPSYPRRSAGACACSSERSAQQLVMAARRQRQAWIADHISNAPRALSRTRIQPRLGILLRVRTAGLSLRLACRSVGQRP